MLYSPRFAHAGDEQSEYERVVTVLPMGTHTLHMTCGMTRRCEDLTFTLTLEAPAAYVKASIRMGFWSNTIHLTPADPSEMPQA